MQEILGHNPDHVQVQARRIDLAEEEKVHNFCTEGCSFPLVDGGPCSAQFLPEHYTRMREYAAELSWGELNMVIMGQVMALTCCESTVRKGPTHLVKQRERNTTFYYHHGLRVCRKTFLFLHGVGEFRLKAVKASYRTCGLATRRHGLIGRTPANALVLEDVQQVVRFIRQYSESNAILLPGRIPGYKRDDIQILPSSTTKRAVWLLYTEVTSSLSVKSAAYSTFTDIWRRLLPYIVVGRPMTDLCWTCQKNSALIVRSANLSEELKSEVN